jgi:hypothetical protein
MLHPFGVNIAAPSAATRSEWPGKVYGRNIGEAEIQTKVGCRKRCTKVQRGKSGGKPPHCKTRPSRQVEFAFSHSQEPSF